RGRATGSPSDVFSLGLTLYQAFERRTVYDNLADLDSSSGQEVLLYLGSLIHAQRNLEFAFDATPAALRPVIERACAIDPGERYADAGEMLADFRSAARADAASGSVHAWSDGDDRPNWPRIALAGAVTLVLAALAVWGMRRVFDDGSRGLLEQTLTR